MLARRLLPLLLVACHPQPSPPPPPARPRLVVLMVIDQLPSWSFATRARLMRKGIGRLLREGAYYPDAAYPYASTTTAAGHAALATGAPPAVTGILANVWYDRALGASREAVEDPAYPFLPIARAAAAPAPATPPGASPARLKVDGIGDVLISARPGAKAIGVSLKERSAILAVGRSRGLAAVWYDEDQAAFTTSAWYAQDLPAWLERLATERPISPRLRTWVWTPLDPALLLGETGGPDDWPGEGDAYGMGTAFPHDLGRSTNPAKAILDTPFGNEVVVEAALAAIDAEGLGADDVPDYLAVSFSAHDYAGHTWGQESWEELDLLLRLDAQIGELLAGLDARVGQGRYAVILTSDHGASRTIERTLARGKPARRVTPQEIEAAAEEAAAGILGQGDWIAAGRDPAIYLSAAARAAPDEQRERVLDAVAGAIGRVNGIALAMRTDRAAGGCDERAGLEALICRAVDPERSGEVYYLPHADSVIMKPPFDATGHAGGSDDERIVPIIVLSPAGRRGTFAGRVSPLSVAPTLAALLGIPPPESAKSPPLPTGY